MADTCIVLRQPKENEGSWLPKKTSHQAVRLSTVGSWVDPRLIRTALHQAAGLPASPACPADLPQMRHQQLCS